MSRQIVLTGQRERVHLKEVLADSESQLQAMLQQHPELLPIEEFGLEGPMMVVGRETSLPAGSADLVGIAPSGDLIIVEFKTGPQNSDFRHSLAQLLDYGAGLWGMEPDEFESAVVRRYLNSSDCPEDAPAKGAGSVTQAAEATWPDRSQEDVELFSQRWQGSLKDGSFHYVVAAQRFTTTMERTIEHLNDQVKSAKMYAVEVVRFTGAGWEAFEARTVIKPAVRSEGSRGKLSEETFLERFNEPAYRGAIEELLDFARGQQLALEWGDAGVSIRVRVSGATQPMTIAWLYPPGIPGWLGLRDLTLGYDRSQAESRLGEPEPEPLANYVSAAATLTDAEAIDSPYVNGYHLDPDATAESVTAITETMASVVKRLAYQT